MDRGDDCLGWVVFQNMGLEVRIVKIKRIKPIFNLSLAANHENFDCDHSSPTFKLFFP